MFRIIACILLFCFCVGHTFSQYDDGFMQVPRFSKCKEPQIPNNHFLMLSNGNIPFSKNGKWGIKNNHDSIIISPVYDSLLVLNHSLNDFIAVQNGNYFLFNDQHLPVFKQSMQHIEWTRDSIIAIDHEGLRTVYSINFNLFTASGYPYASSPTNKVNYLVNRPEIKVEQNPNTKSFSIYEDYIIAMSLEPIEGTYKSDCKLYYGVGKIARSLEVETEGTAYLGNNYLFTGKNNLHFSWIINVINGDTVLKCSNVRANYFEKDGQDYFLLHSLDTITPKSYVVNLAGDTIFQAFGKYGFAGGCLTEHLYTDSLEVVNLYSFPEHQLIEQSIGMSHVLKDYGLFTHLGSSNYDLYGFGNCLYTFYDKQVIGFTSWNKTTLNKVVNIYSISKLQTESIDIVSSNGTLLFHDEIDLAALEYNENMNAYSGYFPMMTENGLGMFIGVYDERNDCIHFLKNSTYEVELIAPNVLIYNKKDDTYIEENKSLINLDGQLYTDKKHIGIRNISIDGHSFIFTWDGTQLVGYNEQMNVICTDCYFNVMRGEPGYEPDRKFLNIWRAENCMSEVLDGNLKKVLPGFYRSAIYNNKGDYFIVINEDNSLEYIRYTNTAYYQKWLEKNTN
ncbi:MAG: hypothetical protein IT221_09920 [Fluviicola sp.]|nr:hypothetical protein [Fluviicola sp.]